MTDRLRGCGTALVTPFTEAGDVDEDALRRLVEWQIGEGIHFLVPCGSTGEAATLTEDEHVRVVRLTAEQAAGRVAVVAGAGSNDTRQAIQLSLRSIEAGATHLLHVSPAYNKPPQRGLIAHFDAIADAVDRPIVLYNVPGRTAGNIAAKTTLQLAQHPQIVGIKEASGDLDQIGEIIRHRPDGFSVLSGDDSVTLPLMALGGDGVISVVGNAVPGPMARLVDAAASGDFEAARDLHDRLARWMSVAFVDTNPIPVKAALAMMGRVANVLRLPLVPLDPAHEAVVGHALKQAGVELP